MSELLVAAPMRVEAMLVGRGTRPVALVRKTGMGPRRARAAAAEIAAERAGALLVLGFCGGLDESSVPGEVIVADEVYAARDEGHHGEAPMSCALRDKLVMALTGRGMKVSSGRIVCSSRLALGDRRAQLLADGAIAVDMESVWLAAGARGRPFGVARVVLDSPSHELLRPQAVFGALRAALALRSVARAVGELPAGLGTRATAAGEGSAGPPVQESTPDAGSDR